MAPFKRSRAEREYRDNPDTTGPPPAPAQADQSRAGATGYSTGQSVWNFTDPGAQQVAEIVGDISVPQITIGAPSPPGEPVAIGPGYRSSPFRPDVILDGWSTPSITVRGVSQRGHLHRYNGAPRQDDLAMHQIPDGRVIVLVADGVSGAPQSHIGANIVTRYAAEWLHTNLGADTHATDWLGLIKSTAWALTERVSSLLGLETPDPVRAEQEFATTLVCAVIETLDVGALRAWVVAVGDSSAWLLSGGQFTPLLAGKTVPDHGVASSAVAGLPRVPPDVAPAVIDIIGDDVLLVGTDGIGDPLGSGQGGVGNLFRNSLTGPVVPSLVEFAHVVDFSRETFDDDRTLAAVWPRKPLLPKPSRGQAPPGGVR